MDVKTIYRLEIWVKTYSGWTWCSLSDFHTDKSALIAKVEFFTEAYNTIEDIVKKSTEESDPADLIEQKWREFISEQLDEEIFDTRFEMPEIRDYNLVND